MDRAIYIYKDRQDYGALPALSLSLSRVIVAMGKRQATGIPLKPPDQCRVGDVNQFTAWTRTKLQEHRVANRQRLGRQRKVHSGWIDSALRIGSHRQHRTQNGNQETNHRHLTMKLRGRTTTSDRRRGRTISSRARSANQTTSHGPLQRLLGASTTA